MLIVGEADSPSIAAPQVLGLMRDFGIEMVKVPLVPAGPSTYVDIVLPLSKRPPMRPTESSESVLVVTMAPVAVLHF